MEEQNMNALEERRRRKTRESIAVYAGSFDPITNGHLDVIQRATKIFDVVYVAVGQHATKKGWLNIQHRLEAINAALDATIYSDPQVYERTRDVTQRWVIADSYKGLTIDYCKKVGATAMIRGLRTVTDFDQEFSMGVANMGLAPEVETVFLLPKPENHFVSSSLVRELWSHEADISEYVLPGVLNIIKQVKS